MFQKQIAHSLLGIALVLMAAPVYAQQPAQPDPGANPYGQMENPYGISIGLEGAKLVADAAVAEAKKHDWKMSIAISDVSGQLVYFEKIDGAETASVQLAQDKAKSAVFYRRPTKIFQDALAQGGVNLRILGMRGAVPLAGGVPLVKDGKVVGAIGVSGGSSQEDGLCAASAAETLH